MKTQSVDNKSRSKNTTALNFYNFKNNDFLKTNVILTQAIHLKTSPDDVPLDQETYIKLIKNNQGISGNLNARKIPNKETAPKTTRNSSTPLLLPLDLMKVKGSSPNIDLSPEPLQLSAKNALSNKISFSSPRPVNSSHAMTTLLSPSVQPPSSARTNVPKTPTESFTMASPRGHQPKKSLFGMTPEEIQALEKQILAKTKLDRDRTETISRLNTRNENKRDMSYFSDRGAKSHTSQGSQNFVMSPRIGSIHLVGPHELPPLTITATPEPILAAQVGHTASSSEKTAQLTNSMSMKKNTDFTSIEEEGPESRDTEFTKRLHTASVMLKKSSIDYSIPGNLPPLGLHKRDIGSISGLPSSSLNDYLFKAHNIASPVHHHHQGRTIKPQTAGSNDNKMVPRMFDSPRRKMFRIDTNEVKKMDTEDLLGEIRREVPSVLSQTPATRQDVMVLSTWMNSKIHQIAENGSLKEEEKNLQYDRLYNICINEVFRQISLECAERGELIHRIWTCYFQIFSQCKLNLEAEIQRLKAEHQKESQRQYEWHQKFIDKKDQDLEDCKLEIQKLLKSQEEDQKNFMKMMHKNMKYKQKIDQLKGIITVNKAQIEEVKDENRRYAKRLAYKIANSTKGTYVPTFHAQYQGGPKENVNLRDSSVPENLGVGSSLASPRKSAVPLTPTAYEEKRYPTVKITTEEEESGSSDSDESSMDFVYEDTVTNSKQVFKIDHLNNNMIMHKKAETNEVDPYQPEGMTERRNVKTCTIAIQTNLVLAESKYDGILDNQKLVDELVTELKVKREIDVMAEVDDLPSLDLSRVQGDFNGDINGNGKNLRRTFSWQTSGLQTMQTMQTRMMIEDRLDGLGKSNNTTPRAEFMKLKKKFTTDPETPINGNAEFNKMVKIVDGDTPKAGHRRVVSDMQYKVIEEEKDSQVEAKGNQMKTATSPKNANYLFVFEPIQEQLEANEDGKSFVKSQSRIAKQSDEIEQVEQPEETGPEEENKNILLEGETEEEQSTQVHAKINHAFETPVAKYNPHGFESSHTTPRNNNTSITSDDLFHNLNEVAAEFGDVVDRGTKYASQIGSIAEDEQDNQNNSLDEKMQLESQQQQKNGQNGSSNKKNTDPIIAEEEPRRAFSLSTLINTKTHAMRMVQMMQAKKEDLAIMDKAKLLTVVRMYKVEKEKIKLLQNSVVELEEQLMNEKENQGKMKDNLDEMKVHIKMLEKLKAKCPHGKCSLCRGEEESEFEEGDNSRNMDSASHDNRTVVNNNDGEREMDEVDEEENENDDNEGEEGEDEEGDGEEGGDAGNEIGEDGVVMRKLTRQFTGKGIKKKKVTAGHQPQFAKKKEVNQNQIVSAAIAIINKVKDKKLTKFRNFMPIKSVLKNIHVLYSERISQAKDNSIVKDEEFFVFAYKWFHNNFGFRKIAEQKYIIFLLSVKKYLHIVRINLFARFLSLLQGSSNFTADEFSKYLEGFELMNNSTLGIPIVNSDTDSKYYVPFLRGLEYLRSFSENKMATDEYIEFKREFEALKEPDPKNINRNGIVDIDLFMTKVLNKYRIICNRTKQFVVNAFKAADLDANKYCSLKEFIIIYRNIDNDRFDQGFAENLFNEHADIKVQGEINLSFDKFTVVCVEYGLFTDLQQDQFLGIQSPQEMDEMIQNLRSNWSMHYVEIDRKLNSAATVSQEDKAYWFSILKVLNERIRDFEKIEANDIKPILIAYKILDNEVEKLLDKDIERDAYGVKIIKAVPTEP